MKTNPTLIERFFSDTPDLFKVVQLIGLLMLFAQHILLHYNITGTITNDLEVAGLLLPFMAQFVVKDIASLQAAPNLLDGILQLIPDLKDQIGQLQTTVNSVTSGHSDQLNKIADEIKTVAQVVTAPTAVVTQTLETPAALDLNSIIKSNTLS